MVTNSLTGVKPQNKVFEIITNTGKMETTISQVKEYLNVPVATDSEVILFLELCKSKGLNPFTKDAYLIKYSANSAATMIVSKNVYFDIANNNQNYDGMESGLWVMDEEGQLIKRDGHIYLNNEKIIGAWARVYRKDKNRPFTQDVNLREYVGLKDGKPNAMWASKPAVMIAKVAEATALRKAFVKEFENMYIEEEISSENNLNRNAMELIQAEKPTQIEQQEPKLNTETGEVLETFDPTA